jgi:hypothetical protein
MTKLEALKLEKEIKDTFETIKNEYCRLGRGFLKFSERKAYESLGYDTFESWFEEQGFAIRSKLLEGTILFIGKGD